MRANLLPVFLCCALLFSFRTSAQSSHQTASDALAAAIGHTARQSTPGGYFDVVFDRFGKRYSLDEIAVYNKTRQRAAGKTSRTTSGSTYAPTTLYTGCTPGYFRIYLEAGCGMDLYATDATEAANLGVLCQVLTDISGFIPSPCTASGQTVNIWVRGGLATGLGVATPFFNIPHSFTKTGITDNTVWETLNSGVDAFKSIAPPVTTSGGGTTGTAGSAIYFHGSIALNFGGSIAWHNDMHTTPAAGESDMYTVILHEMMHIMGFCTLIDYNGRSVFDMYNAPPALAQYQYYSRYDLHLQTMSSVPLIIDSSASCNMYQYSFNAAAAATPGAILSPGGTAGCPAGFYTGGGETDSTVCTTAIPYLGGWGSQIPVYTPACYEKGGSLSHFDDQCYAPSGFCPLCATTNGEYFVMSNSSPNTALGGYSATTNPGVMKRYLTPEERQVLCDIGYPVSTTFGNAANLNDHTYSGAACPGSQVVGFNDGITDTGTYAFSTTSGVSVQISGPSLGTTLLDNDRAAGATMSSITGTSFKCLQVVTGSGTVNIDSGGVGSNVFYTPGVTDFGVQLLRYIPLNASGVEGNITYVFVFVGNLNCIPNACNLVTNAGFEDLLIPGSYGLNLPGENCWSEVNGVAMLIAADSLSVGAYYAWQLPNYYYFLNGIPHPLSAPDNNYYVAFWDGRDAGAGTWLSSSIQEQLPAPLDSGQQYTISFWALLGGPTGVTPTDPAYSSLTGTISPWVGVDTALAGTISNSPTHLQFAIGHTYPVIGSTYVTAGYMPAGFDLLAEFNIVSNNFLWKYYSATITYNGPPDASTLYIQSSLWNDADTAAIIDSNKVIAFDDISIVPAANACPFSIPGPVSSSNPPFDLSTVASVCVPGGTFSWPTMPIITGPGVPKPTITTSSMFDPSRADSASLATAGGGLIPVSYTFTTPAGCKQTVYATIQVDSTAPLLGVNRAAAPPAHIYPNPAKDILHVDVPATADYRLMTIVGTVMQQGALNGGRNNIPLQALPQGIYMLEITDNYGRKTTTRIMKQ